MERQERISVLGIGFDPETVVSAAERIASEARARREKPMAERPLLAVTPNPVIVCGALKDSGLKKLLLSADVCLPDGTGIVGAAARQGTPLPSRVPGIETADAVIRLLSETGGRMWIVGGAPGRAAEAGVALMKKHPGLIVCGTADGYGELKSPELAEEIASSRPDLVAVCLGSPLQEKWAGEHLDALRGAGALMCLGGAVDVWSGHIKRAPAPFLSLGLEWLWRMLREPRRLANLPVLIKFRILTRRKLKKS